MSVIPPAQVILSASVALAAITTRIYWRPVVPENVAAPYVTWSLVSSTPENTLDTPSPIDSYRVQVDCWAPFGKSGATQVIAMADAVRSAFEVTHRCLGVVADDPDYDARLCRISQHFELDIPR